MLRDLHRAKRDPSREKPLTESLPTQEPAGHQRSSADLAEKAEESVRVRAALDGLTSGQRHVISLRYWERMTLQEIADRLGCTTSSVAAKLDRGLRNLRETLGGISPTQDG
jgi:RNA polymerase sigma factor (sigma-70 family)